MFFVHSEQRGIDEVKSAAGDMQLVKVLIYWQRVHVFPDSESKTVVWMLVDTPLM